MSTPGGRLTGCPRKLGSGRTERENRKGGREGREGGKGGREGRERREGGKGGRDRRKEGGTVPIACTVWMFYGPQYLWSEVSWEIPVVSAVLGWLEAGTRGLGHRTGDRLLAGAPG